MKIPLNPPPQQVRIELDGDMYTVFNHETGAIIDGGFTGYESLHQFLDDNNMIAVNLNELLNDSPFTHLNHY